MTCQRCDGLMCPDHPLSFHNAVAALPADFTRDNAQSMRCVNCGNVEDAHILANRAAQLTLFAQPVAS